MPALHPYRGAVRKLVLGIDVGTTYSGISYAILDPGEVPVIHGVTRFPGQENAASDSKVPSILYYRGDGSVHSVGAEAMRPGTDLVASEEDLAFVEWFKLHLRPPGLDKGRINTRELPPLPEGKTVLDVFADFLSYLFNCGKRYISETHANGESLWSSFDNRIEIVLSHPNGWEGVQQGKMRQAAVMAGIIPDTTAGHGRVHFVTEGEASLNFCIQSGLTTEVVQDGKSVMIIDAGGGTVDISSYAFLTTSPVTVEEVTSADCILQGSTRVNLRARHFLKARLEGTAFGNDEDIKSILDYFDKSTKPIFKDEKDRTYIKFGSMGCNEPKVGICRGQLMLTGAEMASFFKPSLDAIVKVVQKQCTDAKQIQTLSTAFLVGGFAASPWLYNSLKEALNSLGILLYRPDSHTNKAVAHGAVCFFIEHFVSARIMKVTVGTEISVKYDREDPEHKKRRHSKYQRPSGRVVLPNGFSTILEKGTRLREHEEVTTSYYQEARDSRTLNSIITDIVCYRGRRVPNCRWVDVDPEMYTPLCTIYADTSQVERHPHTGSRGTYYQQKFNIVLMCGLTELQAQLSWTDANGSIKRGPVKIVYDEELQISR